MFTEAYLEQIEYMQWSFFVKIVGYMQLLTIFAKSSLVDVWLGSK